MIEWVRVLPSVVFAVVDPPFSAALDGGVVHKLRDEGAVHAAPLGLETARHDLEESVATIEESGEVGDHV
jgi:hypothetical protein